MAAPYAFFLAVSQRKQTGFPRGPGDDLSTTLPQRLHVLVVSVLVPSVASAISGTIAVMAQTDSGSINGFPVPVRS